MLQCRLDSDLSTTLILFFPFFSQRSEGQWETAHSVWKTLVCLLSPFWMTWYYVGCLAAFAVWQKELSHLLHSIFISLPTSREAQRDFGCPRQAPLVQQVMKRPCSQGPPNHFSFVAGPMELKEPHHIGSTKLLGKMENDFCRLRITNTVIK